MEERDLPFSLLGTTSLCSINREIGMLILTRRSGETITIGDDIEVIVLRAKGNQIRLGIKAPDDVEIHREEIYERIQQERAKSALG